MVTYEMVKRGRPPVMAKILLELKPGEVVLWPGASRQSIYHIARRNNLSGMLITRVIDGKIYVARKVEEK